MLDRTHWLSQDDVSRQQVGELSDFDGGEIRALRFGLAGTLNFKMPWVYTIAGNLAKSELRKSYRKRETRIVQKRSGEEEYELQITDASPLPDRKTDSSLLRDRIQEALDQIQDIFREAVIMRDIQELSYEEISDISGLPIGTVKSRINRGRAQLQELLKDLYE